VVKVHTDEGITGIGASAMDTAQIIIKQVKPHVLGQDPFATERLIQPMRDPYAPAWEVDIALWDIIGKACGQPIYKLWGGFTDRIRAYASILETGHPEVRVEDALHCLSEGFKAIKLRLHMMTLAEDIALVAAVRQAVGDRMEIMVDANQTNTSYWPRQGPIWTYERALATARELEALGAVWLEEPLPRYNFRDLARLCEAVSIYIAGGENNRGLHEFRWMLEQGVYDILQPEALVSEGLFQCRKIGAMAEIYNRLCVPHMGGTGIGMAAHLQLAASMPNCPYFEYFYQPGVFPIDFYQGNLTEPLMIDEDGNLPVPQKPGIGVDLNEDWIKKYGQKVD
jgi:L-alanine-DL-glutamate epimerase-like enolase superfamily enzyme